MNIDTSQLDVGEVELIQHQFDSSMGSFKTHLWKAIANADGSNLILLEKAFPSQVQAYRRFIGAEGYWMHLLRQAGLVAPPPSSKDEETH